MTLPAEAAFVILAVTAVLATLVLLRARRRDTRALVISGIASTAITLGGCYAAGLVMTTAINAA